MSLEISVRITAKEDYHRRYAVMFMGIKVAVAFNRDSGAKVGHDVQMVSGEIDSGGSQAYWYCIVKKGTIFDLKVNRKFYLKNKNRIKKWNIQVIDDLSISKEQANNEDLYDKRS